MGSKLSTEKAFWRDVSMLDRPLKHLDLFLKSLSEHNYPAITPSKNDQQKNVNPFWKKVFITLAPEAEIP